jgi:hypothetical protein
VTEAKTPEPLKEVRGWYWAPDSLKLRYGDNREIVEGGVHEVDLDQPIKCYNGLHGSKLAGQALGYAPGGYLCRVILSGKFDEDNNYWDDKICASKREYVKIIDGSLVLEKLVRKQICDTLSMWNAPAEVRHWAATGEGREEARGKFGAIQKLNREAASAVNAAQLAFEIMDQSTPYARMKCACDALTYNGYAKTAWFTHWPPGVEKTFEEMCLEAVGEPRLVTGE